MSTFLEFYLVHNSTTKTPQFTVKTIGGETLGWIKWYAQWRRLCFFPTPGTLFDTECLLRISEKVRAEDRRYKEARKNRGKR